MEKGSCSGTPSSTSRSSGRSRRGTATRWARSTTRRSSGIGRRKPEDEEAGRVWAAHAAEEIANWEVFLPTLDRLWRVVPEGPRNPYADLGVKGTGRAARYRSISR